MRVAIVAVGRLKDGPDRALCSTYLDRFNASGRALALGPITENELPESRARTAAARKDDEAARLLARTSDAGTLIALDERGKLFSSTDFARFLQNQRDDGIREVAFAIGGPDGHGKQLLNRAARTMSLSQMTLPHALARIVLAEQLYRAATIIAGHPYHRA